MKKIIIIYLICIIGLFFLPAFLITECNIEDNVVADGIDKKRIKLQISVTGEIVELPLEDYLMGVLVGEMPISYEVEALKAQAVVARTYTLNKIKNSDEAHKNADMCDDINHCQAYKTKEYALNCWDDKEENQKWDKINRAVKETKDEVITYNGSLINAFFHANSGGITEDISNIWGRENIPYLKSVNSEEIDFREERKVFSISDINKVMKNKDSEYVEITGGDEAYTLIDDKIKVLEYNSSGRVNRLQISNIILEGTEVRSLFDLKSTLISIKFENNDVIFETKGYGHGIGLSQDGANAMALKGAKYKEIIKKYYTDVEIKKLEK